MSWHAVERLDYGKWTPIKDAQFPSEGEADNYIDLIRDMDMLVEPRPYRIVPVPPPVAPRSTDAAALPAAIASGPHPNAAGR